MFDMKVWERDEARRLRREDGMAMKAIARQLGVSVGSVSTWTRDIELTGEQLLALASQNPIYNRQLCGQQRRSENARAKRLVAQEHGRALARCGEALHQAGCMLYWAEGAKSRNTVGFANSDVHMLRFFMRFLASCYEITADQYCFSVNCYLNNGLGLDEIESRWLELLELPRTCLRKAIVNTPSIASKRQKRNLPYGTARLVLHSTFVLQSMFGAIQEYAGFDEPAWLG
jgi:transcriptional regulator with XRE-family HTH domain